METVLKVEGMHCAHCHLTVARALMAIPGVSRAEVLPEEGKAVVHHGEKTDVRDFVKAIEAEGYHVARA